MEKLKQLKQQYVKVVKKSLSGEYDDEYFPMRKHQFWCHVSTKQEVSIYILHIIEYKEYPIKLRARRGKNLPNSWDERDPFFIYGGKNWKHNSKRKHQYYREKE